MRSMWFWAKTFVFIHWYSQDKLQKKLKAFCSVLTIKGQVAKESCQKVHAVHDKDRDVGHLLHLLLCWTEIRELKVIWMPCSAMTCHKMLCSQMGVLLAELSVNWQDLGVANKGKSQDGDCVCCLWRHT